MDVLQIKQRFAIIGSDPKLDRAIEVACQVAATDLSVLVTGESGVGKEVIPQIIHQNSPRKHNPYIAVNCGAIPEGTIDSELFGHEKGSFTGAIETRKGYFEEANGGTLFLDEVAELPLSTQVRLLRVLQTGEFIKVGSSKVQKTDVRVVAATNVNLRGAISKGKFREDLYYRLSTVPISIPPLRERKGDIHPLFKKFALDFADKYMTPAVRLTDEAVQLLEAYRWPGNIRQLKSVAEQISVLESDRRVGAETLARYIPSDTGEKLPVRQEDAGADYLSDRDIIFKILWQLRADVDALKACKYPNSDLTVTEIMQEKVMSIGENLQIRRFATYTDNTSVPYVHAGGKIGVLVNLAVEGGIDATEIGKNIAMQIAALNPRFWDKSQVTEDILAEEKKIALALMDQDPKMASKPEAVKEKVVMGKMNKFYEENCLLQMEFVRGDLFQGSVEKYVADAAKKLGGSVKFVDAIRFAKGEGIEKKQEDFAAEVAAQMNMSK